jgi:hypothetical protein
LGRGCEAGVKLLLHFVVELHTQDPAAAAFDLVDDLG